jgi:hypothetical protein
MVADKKGYHDPRFVTFNQIKQLGVLWSNKQGHPIRLKD